MHISAPKRLLVAAGLLLPISAAALVFPSRPVCGDPAPPSPHLYGLDARPAAKPFLGTLPHTPPPMAAGGFQVVNAFPKLSFRDPLFLTPFPDSNQLWCVSREGIIWSFENDPDAATKAVVLDISDHVQGWDDSGMFGVAFHPDFAKKSSPNRGYVYVYYNQADHPIDPHGNRVDPNTKTRDRLSRFTVPDGPGGVPRPDGKIDPASEFILFDQDDRNLYHNGGGLFFGADRMLYLSLGDEGNADDSFGNSQRIDHSLFSGVIRIDVDRDKTHSHPANRQPINGVTHGYFIPDDNPFVGVPGALEEFYAVGLRSPHRMTFDPATKLALIGDVGQNTVEEIDVLEPAANFQWCYREGNIDGPRPRPQKTFGHDKPPIWAYVHGDGNNCVIGGYVYRGKQNPDLAGKYVFGDNGSGRIWAMTGWREGNAKVTELAHMPRNGYSGMGSFGVDAAGELYMLQLGRDDGAIFKFARTGGSGPALPPTLSKTGAFADLAKLEPSPALVPYGVNAPFWSDGAVKTRWIAVPEGQQISFSATGSLTFPVGTVFVKHFDLPADERHPYDTRAGARRRLETRILIEGAKGKVFGGTYRWRADGSDADLVNTAASEDIAVESEPEPADLKAVDIGDPAKPATLAPVDGGYDLTTTARDVSDGSDQVTFAPRPRRGDFDVKLRVAAFDAPDAWAKAGLMARTGTDGRDPFVFVLTRPGNWDLSKVEGRGFALQWRNAAGGAVQKQNVGPAQAFPQAWVRLRRRGDEFAAFTSTDGSAWAPLATATLQLPADLLVGPAVTSHAQNPSETAVARFRDEATLKTQTWYYPGTSDCLTCHSAAAGGVLGVTARQLNGDFTYPNHRTDNQLRTWAHVGLIDPAHESDALNSPKLVPLTDTSAPLQERVRSFLDANCAQCHRPGLAGGYFDARFSTPFENQRLLDAPVRNPLNLPAAKLVTPGDPDRSILYRRLCSTTPGVRMPPLGKNTRDTSAEQVMADWIKSLPAAGK